jgi:hypothetical protein
MPRSEDPLADGQERGELIAGGGGVARFAGPEREVAPEVQRFRVLGARDPLADGQQRIELVAGGGRVARPVQNARLCRTVRVRTDEHQRRSRDRPTTGAAGAV